MFDGKLECLYHGWQFEGSGKCVKIPQVCGFCVFHCVFTDDIPLQLILVFLTHSSLKEQKYHSLLV